MSDESGGAVDIYTGGVGRGNAVTEWLPRWKASGWPSSGNESAQDTDLWRRLDAAMEPHDVRWHWLDRNAGNPDTERAARLAVASMQAIAPEVAVDDSECVHDLPVSWCALCKPPPRGVLARGYRTAAGDAYHNDANCTWMHKGQRRAEQQGKNVHEILSVAWADVPPGELAPCESCCTPQWLKRHGY